MEMSIHNIVQDFSLYLKEKSKDSGLAGNPTTKVTFNCSEALLYVSQCMFYTQLINCVKKSKRRIDGREEIDPVIANQETLLDPTDLIFDILQGMGPTTNTQQSKDMNEANDI